jgi:hypothetical protein
MEGDTQNQLYMTPVQGTKKENILTTGKTQPSTIEGTPNPGGPDSATKPWAIDAIAVETLDVIDNPNSSRKQQINLEIVLKIEGLLQSIHNVCTHVNCIMIHLRICELGTLSSQIA